MVLFQVASPIAAASSVLVASNVAVVATMVAVHFLGPWSLASWCLIYGPVLDLLHFVPPHAAPAWWWCSLALAVVHGAAHVVWPFLDENVGVNRNVSVWQDQTVHLGQAVLVWHMLPNALTASLLAACAVNVVVAYWCWGTPACHDAYVWLSLAPAVASGLHHAAGTLAAASKRRHLATTLAVQAALSTSTYFLFRNSDGVLRWAAHCRFFEIYFVAPHAVGGALAWVSLP